MKHSVAVNNGATATLVQSGLGAAGQTRRVRQVYLASAATGTFIFKNGAGAEIFRMVVNTTFDGTVQVLGSGVAPWAALGADDTLTVTNNTAQPAYLHVYTDIVG